MNKNKATKVFSTPSDWLTLKQHHAGRFFYTSRRGIDSVAVVLISECGEYLGFIIEGKPPFSERMNLAMPMMASALGGSLFDMVHSDEEYALMTPDEQIALAKRTAVKEVREELGYSAIKADYINKTINNSMSDEYVHGVLVQVDMHEKRVPDPQSPTEALALPFWVRLEDVPDNVPCAKAKAIIFDGLVKTKFKKY